MTTNRKPVEPSRPSETVRAAARHQEVARRAYELWQQQGCPEGTAEADWLPAERELHGRDSLIELPGAQPDR
jgi:hypothetical protein